MNLQQYLYFAFHVCSSASYVGIYDRKRILCYSFSVDKTRRKERYHSLLVYAGIAYIDFFVVCSFVDKIYGKGV